MNPWQPITKKIDLKHLGKLSEECGELSAAVARCIIQGLEEKEPITGKINKTWLEEEIADVMANIALVNEHFDLNMGRINTRINKKYDQLKLWHNML